MSERLAGLQLLCLRGCHEWHPGLGSRPGCRAEQLRLSSKTVAPASAQTPAAQSSAWAPPAAASLQEGPPAPPWLQDPGREQGAPQAGGRVVSSHTLDQERKWRASAWSSAAHISSTGPFQLREEPRRRCLRRLPPLASWLGRPQPQHHKVLNRDWPDASFKSGCTLKREQVGGGAWARPMGMRGAVTLPSGNGQGACSTAPLRHCGCSPTDQRGLQLPRGSLGQGVGGGEPCACVSAGREAGPGLCWA